MSQDEVTPQTDIPVVPAAPAAVVTDEPVRKPQARKPAKAQPVPEVTSAPVTIAKPAEPAIKAAPSAKVAKPAKVDKPIKAAKPVKPAKQVKAAKPVKTGKPRPAIRFVKKSRPASAVAARPGKFLSETFPMTTDFTEAFQTVFADAQGKAKAAYEKGTATLAEAGEFAKGNAEAVVESGKILAEGLQKLSTGFVADSKSAFEGLTAEVKELTAAKSPADFFKLQSDLMKKYFETSIAYGSKQGEALMKLSTEAAAPLSRRVSLAVEKAKAA